MIQTNRDFIESLSNGLFVEAVYWMVTRKSKQYHDSKSALVDWLDEECDGEIGRVLWGGIEGEAVEILTSEGFYENKI